MPRQKGEVGRLAVTTQGDRPHSLLMKLNARQFDILNEIREYSGISKTAFVITAIKEKILKDYADRSWGSNF